MMQVSTCFITTERSVKNVKRYDYKRVHCKDGSTHVFRNVKKLVLPNHTYRQPHFRRDELKWLLGSYFDKALGCQIYVYRRHCGIFRIPITPP
jgi:hypothetical protein